MVIKESKFLKELKIYSDYYSLLYEANIDSEDDDSKDDTSTSESEESNNEDDDIDLSMDNTDNEATKDPTETPEKDTLPDNEKGEYISDTKLAMFANILLKAYQAKPEASIPNELLNVTSENANQVISYIEGLLKLNTPTNNIVNDLGKI